jgi:recombination associated protein RdgC
LKEEKTMWFKNLTVFRLPKNYALTVEALHAFLTRMQFSDCGSSDDSSSGFVPPIEKGLLAHCVERQFLLKFTTAKKLLPSSVVNQVLKARADELEEQQGFYPGRKALKDLKERITDELLPRAFTVQSSVSVWIDPVNGWLVMDTSSQNKADDILKHLLKSIDTFPIESLRSKTAPQTAMTDWLAGNEAPKGFTIDQDADLRAHTEDKATVRYVRHSIDPDDVQRHIAAGKQCTKLAMTWDDRISFILTDSLVIKRIKPLDILAESKQDAKDEQERFDADFLLMTAELNKMLDDIVYSLGGELADQLDLVSETSKVAA